MTSWWGWALRRARASTGLLLTLLALVTATTAILAGAVGYSGAAATTAAREAITGAVPQEAGIRVQTRQAADPQAQDAAARERIDAAFSPAPVTVQRTVVTPPRPVTVDGERVEGDLVALSSESLTPDAPDVDERVDVVEGTWPQPSADGEPVQGLLHAAAAQEWDVTVGETLDVGGVPVTVAGLWRPVDPDDAYWFGDRLVATGREDGQRGPLVVDPGAAGELVDAPFVRWTVQPDASEIQPHDLAHLASAAESLRSSLKTPEVEVRGVTVDGDLAPTAATAATNLATASALGVIPLSVLALVTLLSVVQLARLLSTTREAQAQLLVARGATRAQVLVSTLAESAVVTVLGSTFGGLIAWGVLRAVPAGSGQTATVLQVAAVTGLAVLVVLAAVAVLQARRLTAGGTADLSGRTRAATALATLVLVLGAAGVAWWQLGRTGSPLVTREDGTLGTDLVAGAAPALLLAAAAVVAMALLGPLGRLVETLTRPGRSAVGHLASAQVARRLPVYAVPAVLTVLAVGATTLSGLYAGTSAQLRDNLTAVGQGAPVRAVLDEPPQQTQPGVVPAAPDLPTLPGAEAEAPVWLDPTARLGDMSLPVMMSPLEDLSRTIVRPDLPGGARLVPVDAMTAASAAAPSTTNAPTEGGVEIPPGTTEMTVSVEADLTLSPEDLEQLQASYETAAAGIMDGNMGGEQLPEAEAASIARELFDQMLTQSAGASTEWQVTLQLVEQGSDLYREATSSLEVTLPEVLPPWLADQRRPDGGFVVGPGGTPLVDVAPEDVDYSRSEVTQGQGDAELSFTLPEGSAWTLVGVRLTVPRAAERGTGPLLPAVDAAFTARTSDGTDLFGDATADWGSTSMAPPGVVAEIEKENAEVDPDETVTLINPDGSVFTSSPAQPVPPELDTSGATWTITSPASGGFNVYPDEIDVAPGVTYADPTSVGVSPPPGQPVPEADGGPTVDPVPVALTTAAARSSSLAVGDQAELSAFGADLPVVVAAVVPAVPGTLAPVSALLDRDAVATAYAQEERSLPYPDELWVMPEGWPRDGSATTVVEELAGQDGVASVTGPGRVSVTDATQAARLVFWVASAGAVLLAVTGIAAVAATLLSNRRPEVAVLRALGMPPRAQARSRALELGGVVLASVMLGLGASWLVGRAVVPELARSTTARDQVTLPAELLLEPGVWAVLLGVGLLAVLLVVVAQAGRVRAQALDHDYREEIR